MSTTGDNIKKVIKKKGFTLEQIASKMKPGVRNDDGDRQKDILYQKEKLLSELNRLEKQYDSLKREDDKRNVKDRMIDVQGKINHLEKMQSVQQTEVSRNDRITQSALSQMLKGNPSISRVMEIAKIVGVSVSELVGDAPVTRGAIVGATITCPHCKKDIYLHIEDKDYKDYGNDPHDIALMAAEPGPDDRK